MEYTRLEQVTEVFFDKSKSDNFKKFDIIEDTKQKSWIVFKIEEDENTLVVLKYPILKDNSENTKVLLDLNKSNSLIKRVFRT